MMKTKRIFAGAMAALVMSFALVGCGTAENKTDTENSTASLETGEQIDSKVYSVGICQLVQHDALDAATQGFEDKLTELIGEGKVKFELQNAQGDTASCATICNQFVSGNVDLIMCNATPALQAAYTATDTIPVLGTSVTHYGTALDIKDWKGYSEANISGTSDLCSLEDQAAMIKELFPDKKNIGILYCSAEANSKFQVDAITPFLESDGYHVKEYTFSDSNDIAAVVTTACDECDMLYIPTDNTAASNTGIIDNIAQPKNIPIVCGEEGICSGCGVATLSISYYELGCVTAEMAYDVLVNKKDISTMEIRYAPSIKKYDKERCEALGVTIPDDYQAIEKSDASDEG